MKPVVYVCLAAATAVMGLSACSDAAARGAMVVDRTSKTSGGDDKGGNETCADGAICATAAPAPDRPN